MAQTVAGCYLHTTRTPPLTKICIQAQEIPAVMDIGYLPAHRCGTGSVLGLGTGSVCECFSGTCRRPVVFSGSSGFLHQLN